METDTTSPWRIIVADKNRDSRRLDLFLSSRIVGLSRRQAQAMITGRAVTVDGRPGRKGMVLEPGSEVVVWSEPRRKDWSPKPDHDTVLQVVLEDEHLVAVDKPSGIPTVPLSPDEAGTLAGALVARYLECRDIGRNPGDGGLLQRLDRETSGVVLAARSASVYNTLLEAQRQGETEKTYIALIRKTSGELPRRIDSPLQASGPRGSRIKIDKAGVPATTFVRGIRSVGEYQLLEARIHRGQRHQIRVHLARIGCPIVGDILYGLEKRPAGLERLFLHASEVKTVHPVTAAPLVISSPLPEELNSFLADS
ncbi:MAG: RluA family pseudouridine synthase [Deltaproteobacteria bacterium]|nr:RluA family pseudouridine synthase [Deltaproteobacteria bacterium]